MSLLNPDLGSPSSVSRMLQTLMTPPPIQQTPSGGLLQPTPPFVPPHIAQPGPMARPPKQNRLGAIHDWLQSKIVPQAPAGYEGILSSEEIKSARPGLLQSLIGTPDAPSARDRYQQNLRGILEMKQVAGQMASQRQMQAARERIAMQFPAPPGETGEQAIERMKGMFAAYVQAGDMDAAGKLGEVLKSIGQPRASQVKAPEWVDFGGYKALIGPDGKEIRREGKTPTPREPGQQTVGLIAVQEQDGEGGMRTVLRPKVAGLEVPGPNTRTPAGIQKSLATNSAQISVIDNALSELAAYPAGVGLNRGAADLPVIGGAADAYNQRKDPQGVKLRALIGNVGSLVIKDRSGAAVTISESARLRPFIPSIGDTPETIRVKLEQLKAAIVEENNLLQQGGPTPKGSGSEKGSSGSKLDAYRHLLK